jgi:septum formation protein
MSLLAPSSQALKPLFSKVFSPIIRIRTPPMKLVLASTSRYRKSLLERLGLPFEAIAPEVDETPEPGEAADTLVSRLAKAKAQAVARQLEDALVIGSDQLAIVDGEILGKPGTEEKARNQLARLSGREVTFLTGLCLARADSVAGASGAQMEFELIEPPVRFRELSTAQIADYVAREQPLDCAGAFKSEGLGIALFERLGGDDPNALIGLPLIALCSMLERAGLPVLGGRSG